MGWKWEGVSGWGTVGDVSLSVVVVESDGVRWEYV